MEITKELKKEMKTAFTVSFHSNNEFPIMRITQKRNNIEYDAEFRVDLRLPADKHRLFAWIPYANDTGEWQAFVSVIRPGDKIRFYASNNNNQYVTDAGLFHDQLCCDVIRNDRMILNRFVLASSTCPDNTARMIQ